MYRSPFSFWDLQQPPTSQAPAAAVPAASAGSPGAAPADGTDPSAAFNERELRMAQYIVKQQLQREKELVAQIEKRVTASMQEQIVPLLTSTLKVSAPSCSFVLKLFPCGSRIKSNCGSRC